MVASKDTPYTRVAARNGFKFQPREMVQVRSAFGQSTRPLAPADGIVPQDPRFLAAQLQHLVANTVREEILAFDGVEKYIASMDPVPPGLSYDRVTRAQRGETLMQIADLMAWASRFDSVKQVILEHVTRLGARSQAEARDGDDATGAND